MEKKYVAMAFAGVLAAGSAAGQNLLTNPEFVSNLSPWVDQGVGLPPEWDSATVSGAPGSALLTNDASTASVSHVILGQCVEIVPETPYVLTAKYLIPGGQAWTGMVALSQFWYLDTACAGGIQASTGTSFATNVGSWSSLSRPFTPNQFTHSVYFRFMVHKTEAGGTLRAHFDNAFLAPEEIFSDGFESGDVATWSTSIP